MQDADAVPCSHRLHLRDDTSALIVPLHAAAQFRGIVERARIDEVLDMGDEEMAVKIIGGGDAAMPLLVSGGGIDAQGIIRQLADDQPALLRPVERHHDIGLAPGQ